jgi:hypothetical protein
MRRPTTALLIFLLSTGCVTEYVMDNTSGATSNGGLDAASQQQSHPSMHNSGAPDAAAVGSQDAASVAPDAEIVSGADAAEASPDAVTSAMDAAGLPEDAAAPALDATPAAMDAAAAGGALAFGAACSQADDQCDRSMQLVCVLFGQLGTVCSKPCVTNADCPVGSMGQKCSQMGYCRP